MTVYPDLDPAFIPIYQRCHAATMTSIERMYALYKAVEYVVDAGIPGDFAECGVWRGGSVMVIAETLRAKSVGDRHIYLYDTFDGMSAPTKHDQDMGNRSADVLLAAEADPAVSSIWAVAPLDQVKANLAKIDFPLDNYVFVQGRVEETLPRVRPPGLALLRLDTDWYESTLCELQHLYPILATKGVLIVDDYGHWKGVRRAVDEYFAASGRTVLLNRIDYTGRVAIKA